MILLVSVIAVSTIPRSTGMENAEMTRCAAVKVLGQGKMEQIHLLGKEKCNKFNSINKIE